MEVSSHFYTTVPDRVWYVLKIVYSKFLRNNIDDLVAGGLRIQARDVSLSLDKPQRSSVLNIIAARVAQLRPDGPGQVMVALHAGHATLLARVTQRSANALALQAGQPVYAHIKGVALLS